MSRNIEVSLVSAFLFFVAISAFADSQRQWRDLGESGLGPWHVYVDVGSMRKDDRGHFQVHVLDDHRVLQSGVDRYDEDGNYFRDTSFRYRSTVTHYVIDCAKKEEVQLSVAYFEEEMAGGDMILFERPNDAYWTDILASVEPKLFKYVCQRR